MLKIRITKEGMPGQTTISWDNGQQGFMEIDDGKDEDTKKSLVQDFPTWCYDYGVPFQELLDKKEIFVRGSNIKIIEDNEEK